MYVHTQLNKVKKKKMDRHPDKSYQKGFFVGFFCKLLLMLSFFLEEEWLRKRGTCVHIDTHTHTSGLKTVALSVIPQYLTVLTSTAQYTHHFTLKFNWG